MLIRSPGGYSFPSGHALAGVLLCGVLAFLLTRWLTRTWERVPVWFGAVVLIALIGISRVYLGVHWPSDVVAAWLLGGAWLSLCCGAYASWQRLRASERAAA